MKFTIGLDIGTTHTKAVIADDSGKVSWSARETYPSNQPHEGYHEQDPDLVLAAVKKVLAQAKAVIGNEETGCVCFSAAMHSLIAVDEQGRATGPMMTWADTRGKAIAADLKNSPRGTTIRLATGTPIHPMSPLCKIRWLLENEPALFETAARFISIKEYVWFHFTGEYCVDHSIASATGLFDIRNLRWLDDAMDFAGITAARLSSPVPIDHQATVEGIPFVIGASDGALANIGTGAVNEGDMALTIGTSGAVRVLNRQPLDDEAGRLFNYVVDKDFFLCGGAINNGGIALQWLIDSFYTDRPDEDTGRIIEDAGKIPAGAEGLIFLPYVYGERAPVWDAAASGVLIGIRSHHTRSHFLRATLEGICFSLRQIVDALEQNGEQVRMVYASGGFTSSGLWLAILADILGKKICLTPDADASAMGAILVGMRTVGMLDSWQRPPLAVPQEAPVLPDPANAAVYAARYAVFCGLYGKLRDDFPAL